MPAEYDDDHDRPPPFNDLLVQEQGVDVTGGYTSPFADFDVTGYRATAIQVVPDGADVVVRVTWYFSDGSSAVRTWEEKTAKANRPETLHFVNQGDTVYQVTLTGGGGATDYAVVESNQLPLPASAADTNQWPFEYECIDLGSLPDGTGAIAPTVQYWINSGWKSTVDATFYRGFYFDSANVAGKQIVFVLRLGGKGSMWCVQPVVAMGPAEGKLQIEWAQSSHGEDAPGAGDPDDAGIIYDTNALPHPADLVSNPVTWYRCDPYQWDLGAVALSKINASLGTLSQMRIMGDPGDVLSANGGGPSGRGYTSKDMNGGPGIWYLRLSNLVGTTGQSRVRISSLRVIRQTVFDYMTV